MNGKLKALALITYPKSYLIVANKYNKLIAVPNISKTNFFDFKRVYVHQINRYSNVQLRVAQGFKSSQNDSLICMTKNRLYLKMRKPRRTKQCSWVMDIGTNKKRYYRFRSLRWENYICFNKRKEVVACDIQQNQKKNSKYKKFSLITFNSSDLK